MLSILSFCPRSNKPNPVTNNNVQRKVNSYETAFFLAIHPLDVAMQRVTTSKQCKIMASTFKIYCHYNQYKLNGSCVASCSWWISVGFPSLLLLCSIVQRLLTQTSTNPLEGNSSLSTSFPIPRSIFCLSLALIELCNKLCREQLTKLASILNADVSDIESMIS